MTSNVIIIISCFGLNAVQAYTSFNGLYMKVAEEEMNMTKAIVS